MNERRPQSTLEIKNKNNILRKNEEWQKRQQPQQQQKKKRKHSTKENAMEFYSKKQARGIFKTLSLGKQLARNASGKRIASSGAHRWSMAQGMAECVFLEKSTSFSPSYKFNENDITFCLPSPPTILCAK